MSAFNRDALPTWQAYADEQGMQLIGRGKWRTTLCCFHDDTEPSMRVNVESGGWVCMSCGAKGGDVLAHLMQRTGADFQWAAIALGAWDSTKDRHTERRPRSLSATDAMQVIAHELLTLLIVIADIRQGVIPTDTKWHLAYERMRQALDLIPEVAAEFSATFGRDSGGLVRPYRTEGAELIVVALGSVLGTVKDAVDELRDQGIRAGALGITTFRPFPVQAVRAALDGDQRLRRVVVLERALAPGSGGIVTADLRSALDGDTIIDTVVAGLGGRAVTRKSLRAMLIDAERGELPPFSFLDLQTPLVEGELARIRATRRSGPSAENLLRDLSQPVT